MTNTPFFSFIMPAYKADYIKDSINSILGQTYPHLELIIVDDCSPEPVGEVVKDFRDDRLSYHRNEQNIGGRDLVAQWNHCLEYAKGEWVILATDDDMYEPTFLETFLNIMPDHPEVDLFRGRISWIDAKGTITDVERSYERYLSPVQFFYEMMNGMKGGIPQYIFRREQLVEKGGFVNFPKAWGSDDATAIMMSGNGVLMSENPLVSFRWSGQNISTVGKYGLQKVLARIAYSKWVLSHQPETLSDDRFEKFHASQIMSRLLTVTKIQLIDTIKTMPYLQRLTTCTHWYRELSMFSSRDKLSIIFRTLI